MVDIKRQDLTLQDWTKGISADEFAGGSYYYSDGIQTGYSTKGFKLGPALDVGILNERTEGYPIAVFPCKKSLSYTGANFIAFTKDLKLEQEGIRGPVWQQLNPLVEWTGGYVYGDYALIFLQGAIRKVDYLDTFDLEYGNIITNPTFEPDATGWTVGTGWEWNEKGMKHNTGYTGTLETTATLLDDGAIRVVVGIEGCTAGNVDVVVTMGGTPRSALTTEEGRNGDFGGVVANGVEETPITLTITPSEDFNGYINLVTVYTYRDSASSLINGLTAADKHIAIERGGDIYIAGTDTIDILSTIDWSISDSKTLVGAGEEIVALTQQADSIIIWSTNGVDSFQYYWNGIDSAASERIRWQGQVIKGVTGTETLSYVLAGKGSSGKNAYRLYSVSGYQRSLIASNAFKTQSSSWNLEHYHPNKKFVFNDVQGPESMCIYLDNLYLPGCDGIYQFGQTIPGLSKGWSRPIKYDNGADRLFLFQYGGTIGFMYRKNQRQYFAHLRDEYYTHKGYLVTDSIYWDKIGTRKALDKLKLGYRSLASVEGNIKIYAIVDDDYFWRFDVTGVTNRPEIGDIYTVANGTNAEIISINKTSATAGEITLRTVENKGSADIANKRITKVTGNGDSSIDSNYNYDNMCLIKTIETENKEYGSDLIFGKDFVNNYIPYWHKIQLVIELNIKTASSINRSPEIYELSIQSDITDIIL